MIPYGRQDITQEDVEHVISVLKSDFLTQGPVLESFEKEISRYTGAKYAAAVNSATSALHIACMALGLQKGGRLWTSPITFVASANCGLYCGADVDFVDIDPLTYNMSVIALEEKLIHAESKGCLPDIVVPVHLSGQSCDMKSIFDLSRKYGFSVIEDASHAIGAKYKDEPVGSCKYSDITVFSFHPVKIITTGEGGVAVTNNQEIFNKMTLLRSHGITRDVEKMKQFHGNWYYEQIDLGFNYRMTDMQAALGLSQLCRLDAYVRHRNKLSNRYDSLMSDINVMLPYQSDQVYSSRHLYIIRLQKNKRAEVFERLRELGVGVNVHYIPVHMQPYYRQFGFAAGMFPEAESYYKEAISIPIFGAMSFHQQNKVIEKIKLVLGG